ncbi:hypothetical protein [Mesorhizobium sp. f-mel]
MTFPSLRCVSVITLWSYGTPTVVQVAGESCERAVDIITDAIIDDLPLEDICNMPASQSTAYVGQDAMAAKLGPLSAKFEAGHYHQASNDNNKPTPFVDAQTLLSMEFAPIKYVRVCPWQCGRGQAVGRAAEDHGRHGNCNERHDTRRDR